MPYDYSENILIQESAGNLLRDDLDWLVELAYNNKVLCEQDAFGHRDYHEILLIWHFQAALKKLNPWMTQD